MNILNTIISKNILNNKAASKQEKILKASINLFVEKGYSNTATSEIAKAAGVAEGTVFRYYTTKENLLLSIVVTFIEELISDIDNDLMHDVNPEKFETFQEFLKEFLHNRVKFFIENRDIFQIVIKEFLYREDFKEKVLKIFKKGNIEFFKALSNSLDKFKQKGEIQNLPNKTIIRIMVTFIMSNFLTDLLFLPKDKKTNYEEEVTIWVNFIIKGLKSNE